MEENHDWESILFGKNMGILGISIIILSPRLKLASLILWSQVAMILILRY